jgi:hypothetical protein
VQDFIGIDLYEILAADLANNINDCFSNDNENQGHKSAPIKDFAQRTHR